MTCPKTVVYQRTVGDRVVVIPLEVNGSVAMVRYDGVACDYYVRYWYEGKLVQEWIPEMYLRTS